MGWKHICPLMLTLLVPISFAQEGYSRESPFSHLGHGLGLYYGFTPTAPERDGPIKFDFDAPPVDSPSPYVAPEAAPSQPYRSFSPSPPPRSSYPVQHALPYPQYPHEAAKVHASQYGYSAGQYSSYDPYVYSSVGYVA